MVTFDPLLFLDNISAVGRIMAIDPGKKSIGVAISDQKLLYVERYFQFCSKGIPADSHFISEEASDVCGIVMGTPFSHTRNNNWLNYIEKFANKIAALTAKPVLMQDESFSTADSCSIISSISRTKKKDWKDKLSASLILEEVLNIISNINYQKRSDL